MSGRYFEEWTVGEQIEHALRRTVTETDNLLVSTLTHNAQPLHLDATAAQASEFGQILVNGIFTFGLMVGVSVADTTLGVLVANLGYDKIRMPKPVFIGDTLRAETTVSALKPRTLPRRLLCAPGLLLNRSGLPRSGPICSRLPGIYSCRGFGKNRAKSHLTKTCATRRPVLMRKPSRRQSSVPCSPKCRSCRKSTERPC